MRLAFACFGLFLHSTRLFASEPIQLPGSDGQTHAPLQVPEGKKAVVIAFGSPFCNTSNTLLPEFNAITEAFSTAFEFYLVHSEPDLELTQVMEHRELLQVKAIALHDAKQQLVKLTGARVTPEVVVLSATGKTLYQGRINDLYLGPTKRQRKATTADLREALTAIAQGKPAPVDRTEAVGCKISILK